MSPLQAVAIVVIVVGLVVYRYARRKHREQEVAAQESVERELHVRPRRPNLDQIIDSVSWWSTSRLWGPTVRGQNPPPFDQFADKPPAIVGPGRGHAL